MGRGASKVGGGSKSAGGGKSVDSFYTQSREDLIEDLARQMTTEDYDSRLDNGDMQSMAELYAEYNGLDDNAIIDAVRQRVNEKEIAYEAFTDLAFDRATLDSLEVLQPQMQVSKAKFTDYHNSIKMQNVTIDNGDQAINLTFTSQYEPRQTGTPKKAIKTEITARLWEDGNIRAIRTIESTSTKSLKNAQSQYEGMLGKWKKLTGQKNITFK